MVGGTKQTTEATFDIPLGKKKDCGRQTFYQMRQIREHLFEIKKTRLGLLGKNKIISITEYLKGVGALPEHIPNFPGCTCPCPEAPSLLSELGHEQPIALYIKSVILSLKGVLHKNQHRLYFSLFDDEVYDVNIIQKGLAEYEAKLNVDILSPFVKYFAGIDEDSKEVGVRIRLCAEMPGSNVGRFADWNPLETIR
jgi:hypothetical protein